MNTNSAILDAEHFILCVQRTLRLTDVPLPRESMYEALEHIEALLDLLAQYNVDQMYGIDDDVEYDLNPDEQEFDLDPNLGVNDETDYEE